VSQQASVEQSRKIAVWVLYGVLGLAVAVGVIAWLAWHTAIAVIVAVGLTGLALLIVGTLVMAVSRMLTRYPLRPPKDE
jgi:archaellum biogenesis protein FlaJ (TadC family)